MVGGVVDCNVERWDFTEDVVRESGEEDGFEKMKEKEEELNGMRGDRKTEPALRCQPAQIHSRV